MQRLLINKEDIVKSKTKKISKIDKKRRVYVDEAGFDNRENYPYGYSPRGEKTSP